MKRMPDEMSKEEHEYWEGEAEKRGLTGRVWCDEHRAWDCPWCEIERLKADADLGRMVRGMPIGRYLKRIGEYVWLSEDANCRKIASGETPEEALRKAKGEH